MQLTIDVPQSAMHKAFSTNQWIEGGEDSTEALEKFVTRLADKPYAEKYGAPKFATGSVWVDVLSPLELEK